MNVESVCASEDDATEFVVDLREATGTMGRGEAELLMSWVDWVEVEARGCPDLLEGLARLRGAVMRAAADAMLAPVETYNTGGGVSESRKEGPVWTRR